MAPEHPAIHKAALLIAYDNGGINRMRSERQHGSALDRLLAKHDSHMLTPINDWLATLSDEDMETVCAGEASEAEAITSKAPPFTDALLEQIFKEVS